MTESTGFDLTSRPWVAAIDRDGTACEVSLVELFQQAATLREISGDLPSQDVAILRLCLAILQRALEARAPETSEDLPELVEELREGWVDEVVPAVIDYLAEFQDRFDLFHPTQPFFQVAGMHTAKGDTSELGKMIADVPAGNPYLAMRSAKATESISAADAARWLVHVQAYDPAGIKTGVVGHPQGKGGRVYPDGVAWAGQLGIVHLVGGNLRDTLLLNLWATLLDDEERSVDLPAWERPVAQVGPSSDLARRPNGPVDLYTWQPRRVTLFGDSESVTGVLITYGDRFIVQERQGVVVTEPLSLWRYSKPQSAKYKQPIQMPRQLQPGVALWRGLGSFMPTTTQRGEKEPAPTQVVNHAGAMRRSRALADGLVRFRAVTVVYGSNSSVYDEVIEDSLDLPSLVLDPSERALRRVALDGVDAASAAVVALAGLARSLARAAGGSEVDGQGERAYEAGYDALDLPYRSWLRSELAQSTDDPLSAEALWHRAAYRILSGLADDLVAAVPGKAWVGFGAGGKREDVGLAYERFRRKLLTALPRAFAKNDPADETIHTPAVSLEEAQ